MSRDPPTRMLRLIEAEGSTAGVIQAVHGRQFSRHRRHSVMQSTEEPDVRHPHTTFHDRRVRNHGRRPVRSRRVPAGSPDRRTRSRCPHEGSGGTIRRTAERHHASARQPVPRRPRRAPPPASPSRTHLDRARGAASTTPSSPSWTPTTGPFDNPPGGCRRAMPPNSPACLDQRAREFEEGKEKGDAPKGKGSSRRAVSQPHQPEGPDVRFQTYLDRAQRHPFQSR